MDFYCIVRVAEVSPIETVTLLITFICDFSAQIDPMFMLTLLFRVQLGEIEAEKVDNLVFSGTLFTRLVLDAVLVNDLETLKSHERRSV